MVMPVAGSLLRSRTALNLTLAATFFVLFGLLAVSYILFVAAALGIVLAVLALVLVRILSRRQSIAVLLVVAVAALFLVALSLRTGPIIHPDVLVATVPAYSLTIRPGSAGTFVVSEEADVQMESLAAPSAQTSRVRQSGTVTAQSRGLFLQEVTIPPLSTLHVSLPDGTQLSPVLVTDLDARLVVTLQDIPKGSFYAARHALSVVEHPYLDTETLTWSPTDLSEAITFAYVPAPANHLRPLLGPFLTASSISQWLVGIVMAIIAALFGTFVQPALMGKLKAALLPWLPAWMKAEKPGAAPPAA